MQIYCLNDDRGLAGFTQTVSGNTKRRVDDFERKVEEQNLQNKQRHLWKDIQIRGGKITKTSNF